MVERAFTTHFTKKFWNHWRICTSTPVLGYQQPTTNQWPTTTSTHSTFTNVQHQHPTFNNHQRQQQLTAILRQTKRPKNGIGYLDSWFEHCFRISGYATFCCYVLVFSEFFRWTSLLFSSGRGRTWSVHWTRFQEKNGMWGKKHLASYHPLLVRWQSTLNINKQHSTSNTPPNSQQ